MRIGLTRIVLTVAMATIGAVTGVVGLAPPAVAADPDWSTLDVRFYDGIVPP